MTLVRDFFCFAILRAKLPGVSALSHYSGNMNAPSPEERVLSLWRKYGRTALGRRFFSFLFGLGVLLFVWFFAYHDHVTVQVVWIPLIAVVQFVFMLGWTFILSAVTVFYRDVGIVIGHFMRLLFWVSPILWSFMEVAGRGASLQTGLNAFAPSHAQQPEHG